MRRFFQVTENIILFGLVFFYLALIVVAFYIDLKVGW